MEEVKKKTAKHEKRLKCSERFAFILLTNVSLTIYYFALRQMPSHIVWNILSSWRSANLTIVAVQKYSSHIIIPGQHTVMMLVVSPKEIIIARKLPDSAVLGWTFFP